VAAAKSADSSRPRAPAVGSTIQLAFGRRPDPVAAKQAESKPEAIQGFDEPKPQTPADIINSRGFGRRAEASESGYPRQVAALRAAQALAAATDPQSTASVTESFQNKAMAYAPPPLHRSIAPTRHSHRADPAASHPSDAQCRCRGNRNQHPWSPRPQGRTAWSRLDPSRRRPGTTLDAGRDAGGPSARQCDSTTLQRHRDDPDCAAISSSRGPRRHDLLGRSMMADLRPLHGIGDRATADAVVSWSAPPRCAKPQTFCQLVSSSPGCALRTAARTDSHEGTFAGARCGSDPSQRGQFVSWVPRCAIAHLRSRFALSGRRERVLWRSNASQQSPRLLIGLQNGFLLGALVGILLAHPARW